MALAKHRPSVETTKKAVEDEEKRRQSDGAYFHANLEAFIEKYGDCYVAILDKVVVGHSPDCMELLGCVEKKQDGVNPRAYIGYTMMVWSIPPNWILD